MLRRYLPFLLLWLLAACTGEPEPVPTAFSLPLEATQPVEVALDATETASADTPVGENVVGENIVQPITGPLTLPPSFTPTPTQSTTATISVTPSITITDTPTRTATATASATPEPRGILFLAQTAAFATPLPLDALPAIAPTMTLIGGGSNPLIVTAAPVVSQCPYPVPGSFATIISSNPALSAQLGCPVGEPPNPASRNSAVQPFQNGLMIWVDDAPGIIYTIYDNGSFQRFSDTFTAGVDPDGLGLTPPPGLIEPIRGFGKVWNSDPNIQNTLGWATGGETGDTALTLSFGNGRMIYLPTRGNVIVLIYAGGSPMLGTWQIGQF